MKNEKKRCMGCMEIYDARFDLCPHCGYWEKMPVDGLLHLDPGTILMERYIVGRTLGYGGFGITYLGWDLLLERKIAVKEYLPSEFSTRMLHRTEVMVDKAEKKQQQYRDGLKRFIQEAKNLAQMGDIDGIVKIHDSFEANNTAYIVMEYLEGETLAVRLEREGKIPEDETMELMMPVLMALQTVHEKGIIHRDIAPDNIFLAKEADGRIRVKLIDFGASKFATTSHSKSLTVIIKEGYSPEEQYRSNGSQGTYTDVYAIAATMYRMITGIVPPDAMERRTSLESKRKELLEDPSVYCKEISDNHEIAILNAMNVKIENRTETVADFINELISFEPVKRRGSGIRKIDFMKWPLWAKIVVPASSIAAVLLLVLIGANIIRYASNIMLDNTLPDGMARVPEMVNESVTDAETWLEEAGLILSNSGSEFSPELLENLVLSQDVAGGSIVPENSVVTVKVSTGEEYYPMPDVVGMTEEKARMSLESLGLEVLTVAASEKGLSPNCVVSQDVAPFEDVKCGGTVTLGVTEGGSSKGGTAPDLKGMSYEDALKAAAEAGITLTVKEKLFSDQYEDGTIIEQSIQAGQTVKEGESIEISIALKQREFTMPNLLYKSQATALQILQNMGILVKVESEVNELVAAGLVAKQGIDADKNVKTGEKVVLTVSQGSKPFAMPDVKRKKEKDAQDTLLGSGLAVNVQYQYDSSVKVGCVISQSIKAGTDVTRGTVIELLICSDEELITLKDVTGMSKDKAVAALKEQGFKVKAVEDYSSSVEKGKVISQLPVAGNVLVPESTIAISVSKGEKTQPEVKPGNSGNNSNSNSNSSNPGSNNNQSNPSQESVPGTPGTWSDWVSDLPAGVTSADYDIEQKKQYRYRTRETTTSKESSLDGWTLYDTTSSWGSYGAWSDWSTTAVSESDSRKVESKTQYSYRDKETTTSTSSSLSGWTQEGSSTSWSDYGSWSSWSDTKVTASDSRQVETRTVWGYYYYPCPNCGIRMHGYGTCYTWAGGCGGTIPDDFHSTWSTISWDNANLQDWYGTGHSYTTALDGTIWFQWNDGNGDPKTQYRYRDRSQVTTYTYSRWGDWSSYSDTRYTESSTRQVRTRTVYRYCERKKEYTYYYERWGAWSEYSDTAPASGTAGNSDMEVQSRIVYRYRKK